ncbi:hypothetical protein CHUAL_006986 [Chamberlinius hualienensis]
MRYAARHNRLLVLPLSKNYFGHPEKFKVSMASNLTSGHYYSIFAHHSRFNYHEMKTLMPPDTFFVTILREPTSLFESVYDYFGLNVTYLVTIDQYAKLHNTVFNGFDSNNKVLNASNSFSTIINTSNGIFTFFNLTIGVSNGITINTFNFSNIIDTPSGVVTIVNSTSGVLSVLNANSGLITLVNTTDGVIKIFNNSGNPLNFRKYSRIGNNQMAFDLGIDPVFFHFDSIILEKTKELDKQFDLVMISELFSESLILLRHELCWDIDDIVAFKLNSRPQSRKLQLNPEVVNELRKVNRADQIIYDYFYKKMLERIEKFGKSRMELAVKELNDRIKYWYDLCIDSDNAKRNMSDNAKVASYKVNVYKLKQQQMENNMCVNMAKTELPFTSEMLGKQMKFLTNETLIQAFSHLFKNVVTAL